jgi:hypothetical protein
MLFCKYSNIFGKPGEGIHFHIYGIAIIDVIMTIFAAYLLSYFFNENLIYLLITLFILSILFHFIFCVDTTVTLFIKNIFN